MAIAVIVTVFETKRHQDWLHTRAAAGVPPCARIVVARPCGHAVGLKCAIPWHSSTSSPPFYVKEREREVVSTASPHQPNQGAFHERE